MINQLKIRCMTTNGDGKQEEDDVEGGVNVMVTQIKDNECGWIGMINQWDQHEKECPFLVIKCDKCMKHESQRQFIPKHLEECPDMKIPCPLSCGSFILRKNMENHTRNECETLLPCVSLRPQTMEYTTCSNCQRTAKNIVLFMCIKDECDSYGGIYCETCGGLNHSVYDHKFDVNTDHIKALSLEIINKYIKKGMNSWDGLLLSEQKYGEIRRQCESGVIAAFFGGLVGNGADLKYTKELMDVGRELIKGSKNMKQIIDAAGNLTKDIAKNAAGGAAIGAGIMFGIEVAWHSYRFWTGEIETWKEFGYHVAKSVVASVAMGMGSFIGTVDGVIFGSLIGGPIGAIIGGAIGGFIGGIIGSTLGRKAFDKIWKDEWVHDEQRQKTELIKKALYLFGILDVKDIDNPEIFNEKELKKMYRILAKKYHPDKNNGSPESHQKFAEVNTALGVLLALLESKNKRKQVSKLGKMKAIELNHDIKTLKEEYAALRKDLKSAQLMFIIDYLTKWNKKYTLEMVSMRQDILKLISEMNNDHDFEHKVVNKDSDKFVEVIMTWKERKNTEDKGIQEIVNRKFNKQMQDDEKHEDQISEDVEQKIRNPGMSIVSNNDRVDGKEIGQCDNGIQNGKSIEETKDQDMDNGEKKEDEHVNVNDMEDLKDKLRKKNVLDVAKICEEYDEDLTLDELLTWRKKDILETLDEINDDESNKYSISARKKNKFVKIICEFSNRI